MRSASSSTSSSSWIQTSVHRACTCKPDSLHTLSTDMHNMLVRAHAHSHRHTAMHAKQKKGERGRTELEAQMLTRVALRASCSA